MPVKDYSRADDHPEAVRIRPSSRRHHRGRMITPVILTNEVVEAILQRLPSDRLKEHFRIWASSFQNGEKRYFRFEAYEVNQVIKEPINGRYIQMVATRLYNELWEIEPDA